MAAQMTPAVQRTPLQAARVALDDALIAEIEAADAVVLGVPMLAYAAWAAPSRWHAMCATAVSKRCDMTMAMRSPRCTPSRTKALARRSADSR